MSDEADIPTPIDFHDAAQARAWMERTVAIRPWRPAFFDAFAEALEAGPRARVLELGSGPGMLAARLLKDPGIREYVLLDFSEAMHDLARERLGGQSRAHYVTRDFRTTDWVDGLGAFDAVVTLQALHEARHRRRLPTLLSATRTAVRRGGMLLYCDHYAEAMNGVALYVRRDEQPARLKEAGFGDVVRLRDEGGMALYRAINP